MVAQWVKVMATTPEDLTSILGPTWKEQRASCRFPVLPTQTTTWCSPPHPGHTHRVNIILDFKVCVYVVYRENSEEETCRAMTVKSNQKRKHLSSVSGVRDRLSVYPLSHRSRSRYGNCVFESDNNKSLYKMYPDTGLLSSDCDSSPKAHLWHRQGSLLERSVLKGSADPNSLPRGPFPLQCVI